MVRGDTARVTAEWAVESKQAGSYDDYGIVACSRGRLAAHVFDGIRAQYSTGTPEDLPQVTIAFVYGTENAQVVLAIRRWTDQEDAAKRRITRTRYFCVPYAQLAELPPSYENLFHAFDACEPTAADPSGMGEPCAVDVRVLDPKTIAERVNPTAMGAAALLMTGQPVCVVNGEGVPMLERLRFIDTVAALLPYGMRVKLTASTWTSSTSEHNIRLSFAKHVPDGTRSIGWGAAARISQDEREAHRYLNLLNQCTRLADLIDWLAGTTDPLTFGEKGRGRALELLDEFYSQAVPSVESIASDVHAISKLLAECSIAVRHGKVRTLNRIIATLDGVIQKRGGTFDRDEQEHYRNIIEASELLASKPPGSPAPLYYVLLSIGYGPTLTFQDLEHIGRTVRKQRPPELLQVMLRFPAEPIVELLVANALGTEELQGAFRRLQTGDLVGVLARIRDQPDLFKKVFNELEKRGRAGDPELAERLRAHNYLVDAVTSSTESGNTRYVYYGRLLEAAYGSPLGQKEIEEILGSTPGVNPRTAPLLAAAIEMHGGGAGRTIETALVTAIDQSGIGPKTRKAVIRLLADESAAPVAGERSPLLTRLYAFTPSWRSAALILVFTFALVAMVVMVLYMIGFP